MTIFFSVYPCYNNLFLIVFPLIENEFFYLSVDFKKNEYMIVMNTNFLKK